ncbi:oligopeptide transport ATP-binding protein OppD [Pseudoclavibacter endophyticus]|uniref:ABC transporter ATP-binding protein n=1 Tax=Pseudoclavibacter endophyticus TaxID=1778590 RepID=A0A6H9WIJ0_9MICO|nr:ABC transporter ATP-binding protein [Pseudoclavibacter endophyticus]KAB1648327.1 ABC transporter ATP-binding protein [Pseudoclavibacter endophyticus]GGA71691.1 oligopeptide transport ATP-binding protein OppD [Pseudoclavibacter endophyticus]
MSSSRSDQSALVGAENAPLVEVKGLSVELPTGDSESVQAVRDVDLVIRNGERVGLVGESGSGKSVTGRAIAGLLPTSPRVRVEGSIRISGSEMVGAPPKAWDQVRRKTVGMIFQDPLTYLNPTMRVGRQVAESVISSSPGHSRKHDRSDEVVRYLRLAGLDNPEQVAAAFPHELSGGMRQRVLIAIAIAKAPALILADEPTTALDATVQQRVLRTIDETVTDLGTSLLLISHDLAVVAEMADRVYVMYGGRIVEDGPTEHVLHDPKHPYTRALLRSVRSLTDEDTTLYSIPPALRREFALADRIPSAGADLEDGHAS